MQDLAGFVQGALRRAGAVAEPMGADLIDCLLPPAVAASLGLPEETRLRLRGATVEEERQAGYGSPLLAQLCRVAEAATRRWRLLVMPAIPHSERARREAEPALTFQNAVARIESVQETTIDYAVIDARYAAVSEERHEGILSVALDPGEAWCPGFPEALQGYVAEHPEARRPWTAADPTTEIQGRVEPALRLARALVRGEAAHFVARMQKRLQRDATRVDGYYGALLDEIEAKRARSRGDPAVLAEKAAAVQGERRRRISDLGRRYSVTLRLAPLGFLAVRTRALLLEARLQRRKRERPLRLAWNPIVRRFDSWLCAGCGGPASAPFVCDELHLLCSDCGGPCRACGRRGCPACPGSRCACRLRMGPPPT